MVVADIKILRLLLKLLIIFFGLYPALPLSGYCKDFPADFCKANYSRYENSCYKYFETKLTHELAEEMCNRDEAHLVSIENKEENDFLGSLVIPKELDLWIGLKWEKDGFHPDVHSASGWRWLDGSKYSYYPSGGAMCVFPREKCIYMWKHPIDSTQYGLSWHTAGCGARLDRFMCKYENETCNADGTKYNGFCYNDIGERMTNTHAEESCQKRFGGHLVSIHSQEELAAVGNLMKDVQYTWIGLEWGENNTWPLWADESNWSWKDETEYNFLPKGGDFYKLPHSNYCVSYVFSNRCYKDGNSWYTNNCSHKMAFVCERGLSQAIVGRSVDAGPVVGH